jgi:glycosyltransferase involved in cell wall biosynthesis
MASYHARVADLFVSWVGFHGRSARLAADLGAEAAFVAVGRSGNRWTAPVRYARQAVTTVALLRRRRPRVLVVMGPPLALVALAALVHRGVLVLDAHTGAVLRGDRVRRSFVWLARRADVVVVASEALAARVRAEHGIDALAVHDPVPDAAASAPAPSERFTAVFPAGWRADEPMDALLGAAVLVPDVEVVITGRPARTDVPANVRLTGFVDDATYASLLAGAGVVLALTTRPLTMQRAGYEALGFGRPLVASDTDVLREFFTGGTVFAAPTAASLAAAIEEARARSDELAAGMVGLREHRRVEDERALTALRAAIAAAGER